MSDRVLPVLVALLSAMTFLLSCGGSDDVLATVGDTELTADDFRETFDGLSPEEQVRVLDPGGRMALMERIVYRVILEMECSENPPPGAGFWEELYSTAWLASEWISTTAYSFDPAMDDADSLLFSTGFILSIVLVTDSSDAVGIALNWNEMGPSEPSAAMALAPWSSGESSYTRLTGLLAHLPMDLTRLFEGYAGEGAVVRPVYGVWAVGELNITALDSVYDQDEHEGSLLLSRHMVNSTPIEINSASVASLAASVSPVAGTYRVTSPGNFGADGVLASWEEGSLTSGELVEILANVRQENFFEGIPSELSTFAAPGPRLEPGVDIWFYVSRIASAMAQAGLASREGSSVPEYVLSRARAEQHLRLAVLVPLQSPDSADVYAFYEERISDYTLPERRSVLLVYVDSGSIPELIDAGTFEDLSEYRTMFDETGEIIPTPLQPVEVFGELLGSAIFAAAPGVFSGPVLPLGGDLAAYFEVTQVADVETLLPDEIWPVLIDDFRRKRSSQDLDCYLMELWTLHAVEIDSSRVEGIDPWARTY